MQETFKVEYDDMVDDATYKAINAVNNLLKDKNIQFTIEDDGEPHDGFNLIIIKMIEK
jgi:hypothetical protein